MICTWIKIENEWYIGCAGVKVEIVRTNSPAEFDKCPGCNRTIKSEVQMNYRKKFIDDNLKLCEKQLHLLTDWEKSFIINSRTTFKIYGEKSFTQKWYNTLSCNW